MFEMIWTNVSFRIIITWVNLVALLAILTYHSHRLCYLQKDREGSPIKIFKIISFKHLSFVLIIAPLIAAVEQAIMYTPQTTIPDAICELTAQLGIVCIAIAKLALHLFVAVRSQVARGTTNTWYTVGLVLIVSDIAYIMYVVSGIPTIISIQNGVLCQMVEVSLPVYIWFAMNDFVIGMYCLSVFVLPLRKYVWLEAQQVNMEVVKANSASPEPPATALDSELRALTKRIMIFSGIALVSTIIFTLISSIVTASGAVLFPIDSTVNALCVVLQFKRRERTTSDSSASCICGSKSVSSISQMEGSPQTLDVTQRPSTNQVSIVIHGHMPSSAGSQHMTSKPKLKDNVSLSLSLVDNDMPIRADL